jgi:hypothetical protein
MEVSEGPGPFNSQILPVRTCNSPTVTVRPFAHLSRFWGIAQTFTSKRVVSLRPGNEKSSMRRPINLNLEPRAFENLLEPLEDSAHEHHAWRYPSLVVQDPFIKTHVRDSS